MVATSLPLNRDYFGMSASSLGPKYSGILCCPSRPRPTCRNNDGSDNAGRVHYGMSYYQCIFNTDNCATYTYDESTVIPERFLNATYPRPSSTIWVVDTGRGGYPFIATLAAILERVGNVHNGGPNILYMDGHAAYKKLLNVELSEVDPQL